MVLGSSAASAGEQACRGEEVGAWLWASTFARYARLVPYDEGLAFRIRTVVAGDLTVSERAMFGGLCFMVNGNMCFGIVGDDLMVRVGADAYEEAMARPHARAMDFTGRALRGMVYVDPEGTAEYPALEDWLDRGYCFAASLPPKTPTAKR